jgi:hypothetical protein
VAGAPLPAAVGRCEDADVSEQGLCDRLAGRGFEIKAMTLSDLPRSAALTWHAADGGAPLHRS